MVLTFGAGVLCCCTVPPDTVTRAFHNDLGYVATLQICSNTRCTSHPTNISHRVQPDNSLKVNVDGSGVETDGHLRRG
jgi:hypothetical protein